VLPDGSIGCGDKRNARLRSHRCVCCSEGTLGIATETTEFSKQLNQFVFAVTTALKLAVSDIISAGIIPAGMEMMDNLSINAVKMSWQQVVILEMPAILLVAEVEVAANKQRIAVVNRSTTANDPEKRLKLWKGRKAAFAQLVISS